MNVYSIEDYHGWSIEKNQRDFLSSKYREFKVGSTLAKGRPWKKTSKTKKEIWKTGKPGKN